jgi:transcriptional regulator with XRE-family HTH domain
MPSSPTVNEKAVEIRRALGARGWTFHDLATAAGLGYGSVRLLVYGDQSNPRRMWKIEQALGIPIWTPLGVWQERKTATQLLQRDFVLTPFNELRKAAVAAGVRDTRRLTGKRALLAAVLAHARTGKP